MDINTNEWNASIIPTIGARCWELTSFCLPTQRDIERWYQVNNWVICQPISDIETAKINNSIQFSVADGVKWMIINQNFRLKLEALLGVRAMCASFIQSYRMLPACKCPFDLLFWIKWNVWEPFIFTHSTHTLSLSHISNQSFAHTIRKSRTPFCFSRFSLSCACALLIHQSFEIEVLNH